MILGVVGVDACKKVVVLRIVGINLQLEVTTIAEGGANHIASVFLTFAIERKHHLSVVGMRVTRSVFILYHLLARQDGLFYEAGFIGPGTIEMREPYVATTDRQRTGSKLC